MVSHYPAKFGGHRHCGSEDMFLVHEEEDFRCSCFNPPLLYLSRIWLESTRNIVFSPIQVTRA